MGTDPEVGHPLILFDGVCNLCNRSVDLIVRNDSRQTFRFASLQSERARVTLARVGYSHEHLETLLLIDGGHVYSHSTAALRIARRMDAPWRFLYYTFIWIPHPVRDRIYTFIARNRYRWFGKKPMCRIPKPEEQHLFLG